MFHHSPPPTIYGTGLKVDDPLSNPAVRDTYPILTNRSVPPLRLMGTIIVALLAITMAILPISMPQAAMAVAHGHAAAVNAGHDHEHASLDGDHEHAHVQASAADMASVDLNDHGGNSDDCSGPVCCSMATCHAIQVSAPPDVYSPNASQIPMIMVGDDQVGGITAGGLDRPPRTV